MKFAHRAQEWAADKFKFVQYPNIRVINRSSAKLTKVERGLLFFFGAGLGLAGVAAIVVGLFVLYMIITA